MAKKPYPHSSLNFNPPLREPTKIVTDPQRAELEKVVNDAINIIDGTTGPEISITTTTPSTRYPLYPNWMQMQTREKINAVITFISTDKAIQDSVGNLKVSIRDEINKAYERKWGHLRP